MSEPLPLDLHIPATPTPERPSWDGLLVASFTVAGLPAPQGSKKAFAIYKGSGEDRRFTGRTVVVEDNKPRTKTWRNDVRDAAIGFLDGLDPLQRRDDFPLQCAVGLTLTFWLPRPVSHFGTGRNAGRIRDSAPAYPAAKPDIDKLARNTLDALTAAGIYKDDSHVCGLLLRKEYGLRPGASIQIRRLDA